MYFVVIGKDHPGGEPRKAARADHLEFVAEHQAPIVYGGPLIEDGAMVGSIFIFDVPDRAAVEEHFRQDPYFTRGIFATIEVYESRWMVPEREPGLLAAEAIKARA